MLFVFTFAEQADETKTKNKTMTTEEQTPVAAEIATAEGIRVDALALLASVDFLVENNMPPSSVTIAAWKRLAKHFPHIDWNTK